MAKLSQTVHLQHLALGLGAVLLFALAGPLRVWLVHGNDLNNRSLQLVNSTAGIITEYSVSFLNPDTNPVGSIRLQFCSDSALIGYPCTPPTGFDVSAAMLAYQSGLTGFSVSPASTANVLVLTRTPATATVGPASYQLQNIQNPSNNGSYFARLETFASNDASGTRINGNGLAFAINSNVTISTYVPPYLLFCTGITIQPYDCASANGDYIDMGELSTRHTSVGQTQILAATNDLGGYTIRVDGTPPTSGNNIISPLSNPNVSRPGTSQFGLNLRANTTPATGQNISGPGSSAAQPGYDTPDFYKFNPGDTVAVASGANDYRLYTASYIVNIASSQPAGVYVNTITYLGLANF